MNTRPLLIAGLIACVSLVGCTTTPSSGGYRGGYGDTGPAQSYCQDCGIVRRIDLVAPNSTGPSATGAILGGIVGAVAGREISHGTGGSKGNQNISTVAGAAAGAAAGNAIQNHRNGAESYDIQVKMDDGRVIVVNQKSLDGVSENSAVRIVRGKVVLR